jgi:hypothetical protein
MMMNRKGFLGRLTLLGGCTLVVPSVLLHSCNVTPRFWSSLSANDIGLLNELGETILPKTKEMAGAREIQVGKYIVDIVNACLSPDDQNTFLNGLTAIDSKSVADFGKSFEELEEEDKYILLKVLQDEAVAFNEGQEGVLEPEIHYFSLLKELVISGYFTSKEVIIEGFDYNPIPGRYEGCIDFSEIQDKVYKG